MSLARLWPSQDRRQEVYDLVALVYGSFTEGFDTADLQEAKALLSELSVWLDASAELWDEPLAQLIGMVPRWLRTAFIANQDLPAPVRYRFDISSPVEVHEDILVTGAEYQASPSGAEPADAIFRGSTGNYLLLLSGRLQVEQAVASGRLNVEGAPDQAKTLNAWFPGF
ncbi:MAG: hypothetical protein ETSY2_25685 [Candidatus Entotheonella gemina]|uniref:SCP2 domain-containing protein n=2 Tax=Candidatus Entotheonella TaxID=93171 RepID=W4M3Q1_9BACT|nr:MAG: hypothetical protein ETSY2_25685 [Candidatus Entotheonella gemina]